MYGRACPASNLVRLRSPHLTDRSGAWRGGPAIRAERRPLPAEATFVVIGRNEQDAPITVIGRRGLRRDRFAVAAGHWAREATPDPATHQLAKQEARKEILKEDPLVIGGPGGVGFKHALPEVERTDAQGERGDDKLRRALCRPPRVASLSGFPVD